MLTISKITDILNNVGFAPSCLDLNWTFDVRTCTIDLDENTAEDGFMIKVNFMRPDTDSGKIEMGYGRWNYIPQTASDDGVAKTAWLCVEQIVKHELMESFLYNKTRIFDPHKSIDGLSIGSRTVDNLPSKKMVRDTNDIESFNSIYERQNSDILDELEYSEETIDAAIVYNEVSKLMHSDNIRSIDYDQYSDNMKKRIYNRILKEDISNKSSAFANNIIVFLGYLKEEDLLDFTAKFIELLTKAYGTKHKSPFFVSIVDFLKPQIKILLNKGNKEILKEKNK